MNNLSLSLPYAVVSRQDAFLTYNGVDGYYWTKQRYTNSRYTREVADQLAARYSGFVINIEEEV